MGIVKKKLGVRSIHRGIACYLNDFLLKEKKNSLHTSSLSEQSCLYSFKVQKLKVNAKPPFIAAVVGKHQSYFCIGLGSSA